MANDNVLTIDDRKSGGLAATSGNDWYLVTDTVMGGISEGELSVATIAGKTCLHMQGNVSLENNGGFVQMALNPSQDILQQAKTYLGIQLQVYGNGEQYNIHLRTEDTLLPWQSYRASFKANPEWSTLYLPFAEFKPYRTNRVLEISRLKRIGIVAIGREFNADLCIGQIGFYR